MTSAVASNPQPNDTVYIGTYTEHLPHVKGNAEGIYRAIFNPNNGELQLMGMVAKLVNPSYLAIHPNKRWLYAVSEGSKEIGQLVAFEIAADGSLKEINHQSTHGYSPCHVAIDPTGRVVLVANYTSGNACAYVIQPNGGIAPASAVVQHTGNSINTSRQSEAHAHSVTIDPQNKRVLVADLGIDKLMVYTIDHTHGTLSAVGSGNTPAGAGPRHVAFHPNARWVYAINELDSTVSQFNYDAQSGGLTLLATYSTLPADFSATSWCADVHVSADGRFLYGSNRGHDSIAVFAIDSNTGNLTALAYTPTQGNFPRNFAIDPSGKYLLAANQNTSAIVSYHIHPQTGLLAPNGHVLNVPTPVCIVFL
jgi:6-phosphogluconolactonase